MSITVRLWRTEDLAKIGKDPWLTTIFMNGNTFSQEEIKHYPYSQRRVFYVELDGQDPEEEPIRVYATSPAMAKKFIGEEYTGDIVSMTEEITRIKPVTLTKRTAKPKRKRASRPSTGVREMRG